MAYRLNFLASLCLFALSVHAEQHGVPTPSLLRCEGLTHPVGLETSSPRLSWGVQTPTRGGRQTAYRLQAADTPESLLAERSLRWDSGKVESGRSQWVPYGGPALASAERVYWRVKVWDEQGQASAWSQPAFFEAGLMDPADWRADWITAPAFEPVRNAGTELWTRRVIVPPEHNPQLRELSDEQKRQVRKQLTETLQRIRPMPLMRKTFNVQGEVQSARLYVCGLGFSEVTINGQRVEDSYFSPAESHYTAYAHYRIHDIAPLLQQGENVVGVSFGNGLYGDSPGYLPRTYGKDNPLILQLSIQTDQGRQDVLSDETWRCTAGPLLKNSYWLSEVYDATRAEQLKGWDRPGFDERAWVPAVSIDPPTQRLVGQLLPPERATRRIKPVAVSQPRPGVWLFDMGELIVGWAELNVHAPAGTAIAVRYGEQTLQFDGEYEVRVHGSLLQYDDFVNDTPIPGMLSSKTRGNGVAERYKLGNKAIGYHAMTPADVYIAAGHDQGETWHPRYAYHPFRYVELTGYPGTPDAEVVTGVVVHTELASIGSFTSSDPALNALYEAIEHSADYTMHGCVNDNTGTEKQSGLTPAISAGKGAVFFRDVAPLWQKVLADVRAVTPPAMTPRMLGSSLRHTPEVHSRSTIWERYAVQFPWYYRLNLGDTRLMAEHYAFMKGYVDHYTKGFLADGTLPEDRFSDHMDFATTYKQPPPITRPDGSPAQNLPEVRFLTDGQLSGSAYVIGMTRQLSEAAHILGKQEDAQRYADIADRMTARFNELFYLPAREAYGRNPPAKQFTVQGGNSLALHFDLVPPAHREAVLASLVADIQQWGGLSTGMAATVPMIEVLSEHGQIDLAFHLLTRPDYPGPTHSLSFGTRTLPEVWAQPTHPSNASLVQSEYVWLGQWFYTMLAGIVPDPEQPGFEHFHLRPVLPSTLASVSCRTLTPYGPVHSEWQRTGERSLRWRVVIPWNTQATLSIPASAEARVTVGEQDLSDLDGCEVLTRDASRMLCRLPAGDYTIEVSLLP